MRNTPEILFPTLAKYHDDDDNYHLSKACPSQRLSQTLHISCLILFNLLHKTTYLLFLPFKTQRCLVSSSMSHSNNLKFDVQAEHNMLWLFKKKRKKKVGPCSFAVSLTTPLLSIHSNAVGAFYVLVTLRFWECSDE